MTASSTVRPLARHGPLLFEHGVLLAGELAQAASSADLWREAYALWPRARRAEVRGSATDRWRGGEPARRFAQATGGPVQTAFASDLHLLSALALVCGGPVRPSGVGTYSYYERAGDFLALHRDVVGCEVTLLTCLFARGGGGTLWTWPYRRGEPVPSVTATPSLGALPIVLQPGQSAILLGGRVPHCLAPLREGQARVVSVLCYEFA